MISLGTAEAAPGERDTGRLPIGEARDGTEVGLPVAVLNGSEDGSALYLQAASDGDELNGVGVVSRLLPTLDPTDFTGELYVVAVANFYGFQRAEHRNPIDHTKLNRAYPGDPDGSSSDRIAAATFEVARDADLVVDLHQGSTSRMIHETRVRCGRHHDLHEECLQLAKTFDCGYILDKQGPEGQLARAVADEGVPAIDPELGASVGFDEASIEVGLAGVRNVLRSYGFLEGTTDPSTHHRVSGFDQYHSPVGGLVSYEVDLGDRVDAGDALFSVTDVFGGVRETIQAEQAGIVWRTRRLPQVATGEYVLSVGVDVDDV